MGLDPSISDNNPELRTLARIGHNLAREVVVGRKSGVPLDFEMALTRSIDTTAEQMAMLEVPSFNRSSGLAQINATELCRAFVSSIARNVEYKGFLAELFNKDTAELEDHSVSADMTLLRPAVEA